MSAPTTSRRRERRRNRNWPTRLATATAVLDAVRRQGGKVTAEDFPTCLSDGSAFFRECRASAFVTETVQDARFCRTLGRDLAESAMGSTDPKLRFGSGTVCKSTRLGLTEQQPENNVLRASYWKCSGRHPFQARALPAPCSFRPGMKRLGLPRPWDQQWSLQDAADPRLWRPIFWNIEDLFDGSSRLWTAKPSQAPEKWRARGACGPMIDALGGAGRIHRLHEGGSLWSANAARVRVGSSPATTTVVGVNKYLQITEPSSPDRAGQGRVSMVVDPALVEDEHQIDSDSKIGAPQRDRRRRCPKRARSDLKADPLQRVGVTSWNAVHRLRQSRCNDRRMGHDHARSFRRVSRAPTGVGSAVSRPAAQKGIETSCGSSRRMRCP